MQRDTIRDQAKELFSKISFAKTSVADIANACGLGKGTIYLYFKSKDEIMLAIIEDQVERTAAENATFYRDQSIPLSKKVERFFEVLVDELFYLKNLIFGSFENIEGRVLKDIFVKYGRFFDLSVDRFVSIVRQYEPFSSWRSEDLGKEGEELHSLVVGSILLSILTSEWNDKERLKSTVCPLALKLYNAFFVHGRCS
jgi:AcrR family transcriptional regulator